MANIFEIPLSGEAQSFNIDLLDVNYELRVLWNTKANCWMLDIADASNVPLITGLALVTGCDILGQLQYIGLGGSLMVMTDADPNAVPTYENLGSTGHLFFVPAAGGT